MALRRAERSLLVDGKKTGEGRIEFRIYGPEKAFFEKAWTLPDNEKT